MKKLITIALLLAFIAGQGQTIRGTGGVCSGTSGVMVYPGSGITISNGSSWGASLPASYFLNHALDSVITATWVGKFLTPYGGSLLFAPITGSLAYWAKVDTSNTLETKTYNNSKLALKAPLSSPTFSGQMTIGSATDTAKVIYMWDKSGKKWGLSISNTGLIYSVTVTP